MAKSEVKAEQPFRVALIGAETILGKDIQDMLEGRSKKTRVLTFSASGEGTFGEQEGEAVYLEPFGEAIAANEQLVVLAGSQAGAQKCYQVVRDANAPPVVVDALGFLETEKGALLTSTLIHEVKAQPGQLVSLAHPAASALALILSRLSAYKAPVRVVANVLEPASERGQRGISELHKQTAALLAFKPLPKEVFDAQLAFNMLSRLGGEAQVDLAEIERRIHRQMVLLAGQVNAQAAAAQTSLRLAQAPVFHGYSMSVFVEFNAKAEAREVEEALACAQIEVRSLDDQTPDAVAAAGASGLVAGDVRVDTANSKAVWIWVVFDNLRLIADSVADLAAWLRQAHA